MTEPSNATTDGATNDSPPPQKPHGNTGNAHRRKHGARGLLTLSKSIPGDHGDAYRHRVVAAFRRQLEADAGAIHGELPLSLQAAILTVCRCELCIKTFEAWARKSGRTEAERLDVAERVLKWSEQRDRAIERLLGKVGTAGGVGGDADPMRAFYDAIEAAKAKPAGEGEQAK